VGDRRIPDVQVGKRLPIAVSNGISQTVVGAVAT
jgi:hypothetical protein